MFLADCLPCFPSGTIHVFVVDPGVGTERALLHVEAGGQHLLVPDNGCWTLAVDKLDSAPRVRALTEPRFWRQPVSATFHGRDILAPVAARLSLGLVPDELGPPVSTWVKHVLPAPTVAPGRVAGEVILVDHFGNLLTNIPAESLTPLLPRSPRFRAGARDVPRFVRTYGEAEPGSVVALVSSSGTLEIACVQGSAARTLDADVGTPVEVVALRPESSGR